MKYLIIQPLGGLCNRMRVITGGAKLAQLLNKEPLIIWTRDKTLNARFSDLFEPLPYKVLDVRLGSFVQKIIWHVCLKILRYVVLNDEWIGKYALDKELSNWLPQLYGKNILINANLDVFRDGDYSIFKVSPKVLSLDNINVDKTNTIGIHIRRTDNDFAVRYSPTSLFLNRIREDIKVHPQIKFYLATDDPAEETKFISEYGERILIYKKHSLDRNDPAAIRDAVIDLYNLSQCSKIYGSYYSSFSDVAAIWGNIEKEVLKIPTT